MIKLTLHEDEGAQWVLFGRDTTKNSNVIDTNEYLIIAGEEAILLDAGGIEIFPAVLTAVSEVIEVSRIKHYLCSHQDPDIMSSLPLWLGLTPTAKIHISWLWASFVSHFGSEYARNFALLPDEGGSVEVGGRRLDFVPAHYCHSSGNFHLFDPKSRILFSGDMGSALVEPEYPIVVEDFALHTRFMEKFHMRWMPSNSAKNAWVARVRRLAPRMICPQHGSVIKDDDVPRFLDWMEDLDVGRLRQAA